jgi:hypothetical protein
MISPELISQIVGGIVLVVVFISMQTKNIKLVMVCQVICNSLGAASYILLGGFSGSGIYLVATAQSVIFMILRLKEREAPLWLNIVIMAAYIGCSLITFKTYLDVFPLIAAILCAVSLSQKNPKYYRITMLLNGATWTVYDVFIGAFTMLASHIVTSVSAAIGIIRLDIKKNK